MKTAIGFLSAFILFAFISGCCVRQVDLTICSPKKVEISRIDLKRVDFTTDVQATDWRLWFLFIPLGSPPLIEEAMDRCLVKGGGDFMTNAILYDCSFSIVVFSWGAWKIKGDVGNSLSAGAADLPDRRFQ